MRNFGNIRSYAIRVCCPDLWGMRNVNIRCSYLKMVNFNNKGIHHFKGSEHFIACLPVLYFAFCSSKIINIHWHDKAEVELGRVFKFSVDLLILIVSNLINTFPMHSRSVIRIKLELIFDKRQKTNKNKIRNFLCS